MYQPNKGQNAAVRLLVWIALLANSAAAAAYLVRDADSDRPKQLNTRVGNESAGSDIYGIGVRVGFYLQGIAFTMNAFTSETRKGMLLGAAALQASVLASLSVLISRHDISPAEMLIILDIISFSTFPGVLALLTVDSAGQGLGVILFVADSIWTNGLATWFWVKGYRTLPLLDTSNAGFIYVRVQIDGWFRIFNLVFTSVGWLSELAIIVLGVYLLLRSFSYFQDEDDKHKISPYIAWFLPIVPGIAIGLLIITLPLLVVAAERMIQWNDLLPNRDLSAPGQVIPFAVGVVGLSDACLGILKHLTTKGDRVIGGMDRSLPRRPHEYG